MATKTVEQAMENMEYVRRLLGQKQPGFAASLELAASQLERKLREPVMAPQTTAAISALPPRLRWSLTWDQGQEMALHGNGR